jgi:hypothetical protein
VVGGGGGGLGGEIHVRRKRSDDADGCSEADGVGLTNVNFKLNLIKIPPPFIPPLGPPPSTRTFPNSILFRYKIQYVFFAFWGPFLGAIWGSFGGPKST